eukprot:CAMPEP_0173401528 /NCGR_PEP_ID=MMETSP1356-20130122/51184_1 /TAXON_ID=77927 ORGANISM="Hemiselmis virescens, Strain PCC157" /NCGR_SAMPLE_ID=MMETSP1356 /ASSEMBLY_ACC=CAM_ASM_000847 /LENGTH=66 /DNA_ID=CAMNT_0014361681 /DNA_START=553 /DNA_END=749 /DNA_ORIENTATION=+
MPTPTTSPQNSCPGTIGLPDGHTTVPSASPKGIACTLTASTRISTCRGPGEGMGRCMSDALPAECT